MRSDRSSCNAGRFFKISRDDRLSAYSESAESWPLSITEQYFTVLCSLWTLVNVHQQTMLSILHSNSKVGGGAGWYFGYFSSSTTSVSAPRPVHYQNCRCVRLEHWQTLRNQVFWNQLGKSARQTQSSHFHFHKICQHLLHAFGQQNSKSATHQRTQIFVFHFHRFG